jgi:hypothetical protein
MTKFPTWRGDTGASPCALLLNSHRPLCNMFCLDWFHVLVALVRYLACVTSLCCPDTVYKAFSRRRRRHMQFIEVLSIYISNATI